MGASVVISGTWYKVADRSTAGIGESVAAAIAIVSSIPRDHRFDT